VAALLAIKAELKDPDNVLHNWFIHADKPCPCHWKGVACTEDAHVSILYAMYLSLLLPAAASVQH
jgi:hypothetical protein